MSSRSSTADPPILIWEPVPDLCTPEHLADCLETLKLIDVVSPNAAEIGAFYGVEEPEASKKDVIEKHANAWFTSGIGRNGNGPVIIRAGKDGCYVRHSGGSVWLPAYYDGKEDGIDGKKVVDPTGGGNSFIGGLAVGLVRTNDIISAAAHATIAASFAIEQIGMPNLTIGKSSENELWNGVQVQDRLETYMRRLDRLKIKT